MNDGLVIEKLNSNNALKDISFSLKEGTITAIMGKNGCGKTLLIETIFGLHDFDGTVSINRDEAMKMENDICAPQDGVVASVEVSQGATVETDAVLVTLN